MRFAKNLVSDMNAQEIDLKSRMAHRPALWRAGIAVAIAACCLPGAAMSRMGTAEVRDADGVPCFTLPLNRETRAGLRLQTLYVSETRSPDNGVTLPPELWHITVAQGAASPKVLPQSCIRYGQAPAGMVQRTLKQLALFHPYNIAIRLEPDNSGMIAYTAQFCLVADAAGTVKVITVPHSSNDEHRMHACTRQPSPRKPAR